MTESSELLSAAVVNHLSRFSPLTLPEVKAWAAAVGPLKPIGARRAIRTEGVPSSEFYILLSGWAASYLTTSHGDRLMTNIHLPGDVVGSPSMCSDQATETLIALTDVEVATVTLDDFGVLIGSYPRLAAGFILAAQLECVDIARRFTTLSRESAEARIAGFLLSVLERLEASGGEQSQQVEFPLSQEHVGDATGMTVIHVNRIFRKLRAAGVIEKGGKSRFLVNSALLRETAQTRAVQPRTQCDWLPLSKATIGRPLQ